MRKVMWVALAVLLVAVAAPLARADSVTFTCTGDNNNSAPGHPCVVAVPTALDVTFSSSGTTLDITWNSQTFDITMPGDWHDTDSSFFWLASNSLFLIGDGSHPFDIEPNVPVNTSLPGFGGLSEFGTLAFTPGTVSSTPEPGTIALMLLGMAALVLMMRKRIARGIVQGA